MSSNDKHPALLALAGITILTLLGILTHTVGWVHEHRGDLALAILLLILAASGCVVVTALLLHCVRPDTDTDTDVETDSENGITVPGDRVDTGRSIR